MGCTGSKPHHLLSSTIKNNHHNHAKSPQKGFILFNSKTIEYLNANENVIKQKLVERCEQKLAKVMGKSTSRSLFYSARRTILNGRENSANLTNSVLTKEEANGSQAKMNLTLPRNVDSSSPESKFRSECIKEATDFVLKYAINDFDIEDFKSTNHLSMKQIKKDIIKKYSQNKISTDKLDTSLNQSKSNYTSKTLTLQSGKGFSSEVYKNVLNAVIDEFGLFVQENFVIINEFNVIKKDENEIVETNSDQLLEDQKEAQNSQESELLTNQSSEEEDLKLKEALELARQNFYKGKVSMVCLNKKGGYVVKEVADKSENLNDSVCSGDLKEEENISNTTPLINIEYIENKENKSISNASVISFKDNDSSNRIIANSFKVEDLQSKKDISQMINETIDLIVKYSTKSASENPISIDSFLEQLLVTKNFTDIEALSKQNTENHLLIDCLKVNFENAKNIIKVFEGMEKKDLSLIDNNLIASLHNFDHVNKEFKAYLSILEDTFEQQLEKINSIICTLNENEDKNNLNNLIRFRDEKIVSFLEKNVLVRKYAEEVHFKLQNLSTELIESNVSIVNSNFNQKITHETQVDNDTKQEIKDIENSNVLSVEQNSADSKLTVEEKIEILESEHSETVEGIVELLEVFESKVEDNNDLLQVDIEENSNIDAAIKNPASQESLASTLSSNFYSSSASITPPGSILTEQINKKSDELTESEKESNNTEYPQLNAAYLSNHDDNLTNDFILNKEMTNWNNEIFSDISQNLKNEGKSQEVINNFQNNIEQKAEPTTSVSISNEIELDNKTDESSIQNYISNMIENNENINQTEIVNLNHEQIKKRASLDEELLNQINDVEKKVKYMNETCSENDDDNEFEDERLNFDPSFENEDENEERLFHPRRPSKIKSEVRQNRAIDLQEEIKQISNVIQDLVQTINVKKSNSDNNNSDNHSNRESLIENETDADTAQRKSLTTKQITSSIPVRQRNLNKQKDSSMEDESFESFNLSNNQSVVFETSVDFSSISDTSACLNVSAVSNSGKMTHKNKKNSKSKFKSKLPVKK